MAWQLFCDMIRYSEITVLKTRVFPKSKAPAFFFPSPFFFGPAWVYMPPNFNPYLSPRHVLVMLLFDLLSSVHKPEAAPHPQASLSTWGSSPAPTEVSSHPPVVISFFQTSTLPRSSPELLPICFPPVLTFFSAPLTPRTDPCVLTE